MDWPETADNLTHTLEMCWNLFWYDLPPQVHLVLLVSLWFPPGYNDCSWLS